MGGRYVRERGYGTGPEAKKSIWGEEDNYPSYESKPGVKGK